MPYPCQYFWSSGMWIFPLVMIALMVTLCVLLFRRGCVPWWHGSGYPPGGPTQETPLDILKRRYVSGEITKEDFERMKKDIQD